MNESLIYQRIPAIMEDIDAIKKGRSNSQQNYKFRGIDDVYNELHNLLAKHKVFTMPEVLEERSEERSSRSGGALIYRILKMRYSFFTEDGSCVQAVVIGEGMDSGDKASNKAMAVAHKYALLQVFTIPTEESKDPENESPAVLPKSRERPHTGPTSDSVPEVDPKAVLDPSEAKSDRKTLDEMTEEELYRKVEDGIIKCVELGLITDEERLSMLNYAAQIKRNKQKLIEMVHSLARKINPPKQGEL